MQINDSLINAAREKSVIQYLESIGIPVDSKKSNRTYAFFRSPFRNENDSSFVVKINTNKWKDYGDGTYGDVISLVMKLEKLSYPKAIERLIGIPLRRSENMKEYVKQKHISSVKVLSVKEINNKALIDYLHFRRIDIDIARHYCKEVECDNNGKIWRAVGFPNNSGSWELRSKWIKIALAPKDISTIKIEGCKDYCTFEGFSNFLSYLTYYKKLADTNIIVLNSVSMVGRVKWEEIEGNNYYYGDADTSGSTCISKIVRAIDKRHEFAPYNDWNKFLTETSIY